VPNHGGGEIVRRAFRRRRRTSTRARTGSMVRRSTRCANASIAFVDRERVDRAIRGGGMREGFDWLTPMMAPGGV